MRVLRWALALAALALLLAAGGAARIPSAVQTTSYRWVQPPSFVGVAPIAVGPTTSYVWEQPPSWVAAG